MAKKKEAGKPPELNDEKEKGSGNLFPGMKIPKEIEALARKMKEAEIERKAAAGREREARENLCAIMEHDKVKKFQIEIDGADYEFELDTESRVKSKKIQEEE